MLAVRSVKSFNLLVLAEAIIGGRNRSQSHYISGCRKFCSGFRQRNFDYAQGHIPARYSDVLMIDIVIEQWRRKDSPLYL